MLQTDSEGLFKSVLADCQSALWSRMGEKAFVSVFYNNMKSQVYKFGTNVSARSARDAQDVLKVTNEITDFIVLAQNQFEIDIRKELKQALFPYIMNEYVLRLSYVVFTNKAVAQTLRDSFRRDFEYLMDFFCHQSDRGGEEGFTRPFFRFKQLYFDEQTFADDKDDPLKHFVYKLRFKK